MMSGPRTARAPSARPTQSGNRVPTVLISRISAALRMPPCQSTSPSTRTRIDHALRHVTSISHRPASLVVAELTYLAQRILQLPTAAVTGKPARPRSIAARLACVRLLTPSLA